MTYGWRVGECPDDMKTAKAQVLKLENAEEIAPGQVSASFTTLEPSDISLEISPAIALEDSVITFRGHLTPIIPNQNVTIYLGISGSPWTVLATTATQQDGSFSYAWKSPLEGVYAIPPEFVALQIDAVVKDIGADAVKIGMLSNRRIIEIVAGKVAAHRLQPLVVDPVMVAKSGDALLEPEARDALMSLLLPLASVVTPNLPEAEVLCGFPVTDMDAMRRAAHAIAALGEP